MSKCLMRSNQPQLAHSLKPSLTAALISSHNSPCHAAPARRQAVVPLAGASPHKVIDAWLCPDVEFPIDRCRQPPRAWQSLQRCPPLSQAVAIQPKVVPLALSCVEDRWFRRQTIPIALRVKITASPHLFPLPCLSFSALGSSLVRNRSQLTRTRTCR